VSESRKCKVWWSEYYPDAWKEGKVILDKNRCEVIMGRPTTEARSPYSEDEILDICRDVDAILLIARERMTSRIFESLENLRVVVRCGVGVDNVDVKAATRNGVLVANTPVPEDYIGVAEGTVARILSLAKKIVECDRNVKENLWLKNYNEMRGTYLKGKTIAILGFGRIGSTVAKLMKPWGVRVISFDPYVQSEKLELLDVEPVDFDALLKESDFLSIHSVLTDETRHMIDERALRKMKKTAYVINTARGPIIEEKALYKALRGGWIAGAALDVFEKEPPVESPILSPEISHKLLLSPHVAGLSREMERALTFFQVDCCLSALNGIPPTSTLNPEVSERWGEKFS
jgi:D-3-phosphoglycerate dehydrogenase